MPGLTQVYGFEPEVWDRMTFDEVREYEQQYDAWLRQQVVTDAGP